MALPTERELLARVDPQLDAALKENLKVMQKLGMPSPGPAGARALMAKAREHWNQGGPEMSAAKALTIPGPLRDIPVMAYFPSDTQGLPVYVYLHAGSYRHGDQRANDRQMRELAQAWGGVVVSADYAHVPEQVFPAAVEETAAVYQWLASRGSDWGIDGGRIAFGGASVGANVALGAAIQLGGTRTGFLKAGVMFYAVFGDDLETESMELFSQGGHFSPSRKSLTQTFADYVKDDAQRGDARFNCSKADPAMVPPLFLAAAELDAARDASKTLAGRLTAAGRPCTLKVYEGMLHMFLGYSKSVDKARECIADAAAFLGEQLPTAS